MSSTADCDGCLIIEERGDVADLKCNSCNSLVDTVRPRGPEIDGTRFVEIIPESRSSCPGIPTSEVCSARCPHCGAINVFPGYTVIEAFSWRECGEGVSVERPVQ